MRSLRAAIFVSALVAPTSLAAQADSERRPYLEITVLDVGHGDAIVIREPDGRVAMVDAGSRDILRFLQRMRVDSLALLVGTDPTAAHSGGLIDVLTARPVATFVGDWGEGSATDRLRATLGRLDAVSVATVAETPLELHFGAASVRILPTIDSASARGGTVGVLVEYGTFRALLVGDAGRDELGAWIDAGVVPDVTMLKAPDHGSPRGVNRPFLTVSEPEVVVVSVGTENPSGLPRPEAMTAYDAAAAEVYRTDRGGHVTVLGFADGSYEVVRPTNLSSITPAGDIRPSNAGPRPLERGTLAPFSMLSVDVEAGAGEPGRDLNSEYVTVANHGPADIPIGGWTVCDLSTRCFRFPPDAAIRASSMVRVYSGYGHTDGYAFFMNETRPVWNDDGDQATLSDPAGRVRGRHVY